MTIATLARTDVVTAGPDTPLVDVASQMGKKNVGCVVVVDAAKKVHGLVTDRDITVSVVGMNKDPKTLTAGDVMSKQPFTAEADTGIFQCINAMRDAEVRRCPVVKNDKLMGIVTMDDLLVLLSGEFADLAAIAQAESPPYAKAGKP